MANQQNIPNDQDRMLTEDFGAYLNGDKPLQAINDPLLQVLKPLKEQYEANEVLPKQEIAWQSIQNQLKKHENQPLSKVNPFRLWSVPWLAVAASVIIMGLFAYRMMTDSPETILYQSGQQIAEFSLPAGSKVHLRPHSTLEVRQSSDNQETYYLEGEAFFDVAKKAGRVFQVQTASGTVRVLGTKFNLSYRKNELKAYLQEGHIQLKSIAANHQIDLHDGEAASINDSGQIQKIVAAQESIYLDWMDATFAFSNEAIGQAIPELEQHFNIEIILPQQIAETKVSGSISLRSAEESLSYLGLILGGKFELKQDGIYEFILD